jgi:hypothetical protein
VAQSRRIETLGTHGACPLCPDRYQIRPTRLNVAEYQKATLARLFDHLVGAQQEAYIPFRRLLWCSTCVIVGSTLVVYDMASISGE